MISSLLLNYFGRFDLGERLNLLVGGSAGFIENVGPTLLGLSTELKVDEIRSHFVLGVQHERWSGWGITENRAESYWDFRPLPSLSLAVGYSYRAPQYRGLGIQSLSWPTATAEWGALYRLEWKFLGHSDSQVARLSASFLVWNYDRMRLATSDNIHFSIIPSYRLSQSGSLQVMLMTAVKGFSGAVVSWDQLDLGLGWKYDF